MSVIVVRPEALIEQTHGLTYIGEMDLLSADTSFNSEEFRLIHKRKGDGQWCFFTIGFITDAAEDGTDMYRIKYEDGEATIREDEVIHVFEKVVLDEQPLVDELDVDTEEIVSIRQFTKLEEINYIKKCAEQASNDSYIRMLLSPALLTRFEADVKNDGVPNYYEQIGELEAMLTTLRSEKDMEIVRLQQDLAQANRSRDVATGSLKRMTAKLQSKDADISSLRSDLEAAQGDVREMKMQLDNANAKLLSLKAEKFDHVMQLINGATESAQTMATKLDFEQKRSAIMMRWIKGQVLHVPIPGEALNALNEKIPGTFYDEIEAAKAAAKLLRQGNFDYQEAYEALRPLHDRTLRDLTDAQDDNKALRKYVYNRAVAQRDIEARAFFPDLASVVGAIKNTSSNQCLRCEKPVPEDRDDLYCSDECKQLFGM